MAVKTSVAPEARRAAMSVLRDVLTEENTDRFLDVLFFSLRLPWWVPAMIARRVLDALLPEVLLAALSRILDEKPDAPEAPPPS